MKRLFIHEKHLVTVYAILPVGLVFMLVDIWFLKGSISQRLPVDPNEYIWFTILFTLPHILASFFSFFDAEYIKEYGSRLLRGSQLSVLAIFVLPLISFEAAFFVFAIFTMIHVLFQQSGVARSIMHGSNRYHGYWQWLGAAIAALLYLDVYTDFLISTPWYWLLGLLVFIFTVVGMKAAKASTTKLGSAYFWLTHATIVASLAFFVLGYPILTIAIPRIIHDVTAYMYYVTHDNNRFEASKSNQLYRLGRAVGIPIVIMSPVFSIGLAWVLQLSWISGYVLPVISVLILMHYHTENYIWKRGSLHRKYVRLIE